MSRFNRWLMPAILLVMSTVAAAAAGPTHAPGDDPDAAAIRALLSRWDHADTPGAIVAVTLGAAPVQTFVAGLADLEHSVPITPTTVFHAASLSKQFTAFAIVLLEQDGKLSLDDTLSTHLPEANALGAVTLRQLMNHTGGVRDQWTLLRAAGWRAEDLVTDPQVLHMLLNQRGGNFAPGTAYQYSNSGYSLLAEVVRRVSGQSLAEFCGARIFQPLGMTHTRFQDDIAAVVPGRALSYRPAAAGYVRAVLNYATVGPSGLQTTAEDLGRWALQLQSPTVGGEAAIRRMAEQGVLDDGTTNAYALGQERRAYNGLDTWSHGGRDAGYRSFLLRIPDQRFSVAVLSNAADFDTAAVAFAVADHYLSSRPGYTPARPEAAVMPTREQLESYAGNYELFPGLIFTVGTDGRRLLFGQLGSPQPGELQALSGTSFQLDPTAGIAIEFGATKGGKASAFDYRIGLHGSILAKRIALSPFASDNVTLADFVGRYYSPELATSYHLRVDGERLVAVHPRSRPIQLRAYQTDVFSGAEWYFQRVVFQRSESGRVTGFLLSGALAEDVAFTREE